MSSRKSSSGSARRLAGRSVSRQSCGRRQRRGVGGGRALLAGAGSTPPCGAGRSAAYDVWARCPVVNLPPSTAMPKHRVDVDRVVVQPVLGRDLAALELRPCVSALVWPVLPVQLLPDRDLDVLQVGVGGGDLDDRSRADRPGPRRAPGRTCVDLRPGSCDAGCTAYCVGELLAEHALGQARGDVAGGRSPSGSGPTGPAGRSATARCTPCRSEMVVASIVLIDTVLRRRRSRPQPGWTPSDPQPLRSEAGERRRPRRREPALSGQDHDDSLLAVLVTLLVSLLVGARSGSITVSMTVRAHSSRATPSIGRPATGARRACGRGTSMVPSWVLTMLRGIQPVEPDDARLRQVDRREPDVAAGDRHLGDARPAGPAPGTGRPAAATPPRPAARRSGRRARRGSGRRRRRCGPRPAVGTSPAAAARWGCRCAAGGRRPAARSGPRRGRRPRRRRTRNSATASPTSRT